MRGGDARTSRHVTWAAAWPAVGLGCLISWTYVVYLSWAVLTPSHGDALLLDTAYPASYVGLVLVLLAGVVLSRAVPRVAALLDGVLDGRADDSQSDSQTKASRVNGAQLALGIGAVLVMCLGTGLLILGEQGQFATLLYLASALLPGLGLGVLYLLWASVIARLPRQAIPGCIALAFVIGAAIYTLALHLPAAPTHLISLGLPIVSLICLVLGSSTSESSAREPIHGLSPQMLPRTVCCFCLLSFAEGLSRGFFLQANVHANPLLHRWVFLIATAGACALLLLASLRGHGRVGITSTGRAGMLMLALMFLLTPIVKDAGLTADILTMASHVLLLLIEWTLLTQIANAYRLPALHTYGLGLGLTYLGWVAGDVIGNAMSTRLQMSYQAESLLALGCACLVMLAFFLIAHDRSIAEIASEDSHEAKPRRFMQRCEDIAQRYGLTKKETEVMVLVAKGRTAQRVQEIMGISLGTVNTHLSHIYRKLGVHTKQEMLDKLEED